MASRWNEKMAWSVWAFRSSTKCTETRYLNRFLSSTSLTSWPDCRLPTPTPASLSSCLRPRLCPPELRQTRRMRIPGVRERRPGNCPGIRHYKDHVYDDITIEVLVTYYPPGVWDTRPESSQGKYSDLVEPQREPRSKPDFLLTTSVI